MDVNEVLGISTAPTLVLDYTNHRGVMGRRTVIPIRCRYGLSPFHDGEQLFLTAFDVDKNDVRDFAVKDIHSWETVGRDHDVRGMMMAAHPRSSKWPNVRKAHLEKEGACAACGTTKNLEVHHVQPFHLFPDLELEQSNLITLCETTSHNDHFLFGHCLNWRQFNPNVRDDAARALAMIQNRKDA